MATSTREKTMTVEQLVRAVQKLPAEERREFQRRLVEGEHRNGEELHDEAALHQAADARLPDAEKRRLRRLIARSERGQLTPQELADYRSLAEQARRIDVARVEAQAELARLGRSKAKGRFRIGDRARVMSIWPDAVVEIVEVRGPSGVWCSRERNRWQGFRCRNFAELLLFAA